MPDDQAWKLILLVVSGIFALFGGMCTFYMRTNSKAIEKLTDLAFYHEGQIKAAHAEITGLKSDVTRIKNRLDTPMHGTRYGEMGSV